MDVRDVGVALWRQRALVLVILAISSVGVVAGILLAPTTYAATVTISAASAPGADGGDDSDAARSALAELASSRAVAERVIRSISVDRSVSELRGAIHGEWVRGTNLVEVTVEDRDPEAASMIAESVATVLTDDEVVETLAGPAVKRSLELASDRVVPDPEAAGPLDPRLSAALGVLLAVGLAIAAAVWRDRRTHTITDAATAEEAATAPVLAHLSPPADLTAMPALNPGTVEAEVFRHLRSALEQQAEAGVCRVVVAGVTDGDLNVWIGANVAISLAHNGHRVLLVDGRMGERFGTPVEDAPDTPGLYDVLLGAELSAAVSPGPVDLLQVLPAGTYGVASTARLIADRFESVMHSARARFDHIVVIGPPLDVCDDSRAMAVDSAIVLVLAEGTVSSAALRAHADRIRAVGSRVLGVALVARRSERIAA